MSGRFRLKAREWLGDPGRKRVYNERHFAEAAPRYDTATRMMSLGRDAAWKRALVASLPDFPSPVCVDLACGTGDVAFLLAQRYPGARITGVDLSAPMLAVARERNRFANVRFERGDLCALPFPDGSADVVTGGYALRNAPVLRDAVAEVRRVLSPGGAAAFLDFSNPERVLPRRLQSLLLRGWCGLWGLLLHGTPEVHGYVAESLRGFPSRERLAGIFSEAGLERSGGRGFFGGIVRMTVLRKGDLPARAEV
ncbi:MAG: bifunctional demethylmenaquinone methyltransferase/2-methoxy-6-polyprenyl-1,4-benzoquinol methylase UbiE [Deltaproteobacteria bacterium]